NTAAVLTQVQMTVEPGVRRDVRRDVPAATSQIADEHPPARETAPRCGHTAHEHMMLMTMHDVGVANFATHIEAEWIGTLSANEPWITNRPHPQRAHLLIARLVSKRDQRRRHAF